MTVLEVNCASLIQHLSLGAFVIKESLHNNAKENDYM